MKDERVICEGVDPETNSDKWYHEKEIGIIKDDNSEVYELRVFLLSLGYQFPEVIVLNE